MLKLIAFLIGLTFMVSGCAGKSKQKSAGIYGMTPPMAAPPPAVMFTGDVKVQFVPWTEGMSLAQGLLGAQYTGSWDPHLITITRGGVSYRVDARRFLRGEENPELQVGDLINVHH
jgi:hypothetical protein